MARYTYNGTGFDAVSQDKLTPGEIDAVERVTGLTFAKMRRMFGTCVCEHGIREHQHKDDAGEQTNDTSCTVCSCDSHESDVPTRVSTAFLWVSLKRKDPTAKFADFESTPVNDLVTDDEDETSDEDPTEPPHAEA